MKRFLVAFVAIAAILAVTVPASALEVKYGGLFRARVISQSDFPNVSLTGAVNDATFAYTDHMNRLDQRLRIYMYFVASENLRLVTKFEANTVWGDVGSSNSPNPGKSFDYDITGGGNVGADVNNFGIKNAYIDFAIPNTPARAFVGVQGIALEDSWIVDSDFSAAVVQAKLDPVKITAGYIAGMNYIYTDENENIDDFFIALDYVGGPFRASLNFFYQYGHDTLATVFPQIMSDPTYTKFGQWPEADSFATFKPSPVWEEMFDADLNPFTLAARDNQFFDLGVSLGYKIDYLSAYVNFVKNFGSVELWAISDGVGEAREFDYTGWMIDAGLTYFCGPWTFNVGGFYTTGQDVKVENADDLIDLLNTDEIQWFTYPIGTVKYFSEIMGGGILDNTAPNGGLWKGYQTPFNIWTVTVGAAWQVLPQTKLSASYWYFGTSEEVPAIEDGYLGWSSDLGHEFDFYLTQGIVDKLTLDLVAAYMVTGDAFDLSRDLDDDDNGDDVYELGARLQWSF